MKQLINVNNINMFKMRVKLHVKVNISLINNSGAKNVDCNEKVDEDWLWTLYLFSFQINEFI